MLPAHGLSLLYQGTTTFWSLWMEFCQLNLLSLPSGNMLTCLAWRHDTLFNPNTVVLLGVSPWSAAEDLCAWSWPLLSGLMGFLSQYPGQGKRSQWAKLLTAVWFTLNKQLREWFDPLCFLLFVSYCGSRCYLLWSAGGTCRPQKT